ncbi:MAG: FGGY family carbohydrate kinase [Spirochaetia bacterium]
MKALLGIDLGTTGIRGTLLNTAGEVLARRSHGYTARARWIDPAGWEAQAEVSIFLDALKNIIPETLDAGRISPSAVQGIAISAMAPDAVAVDARAQALMPCILWMDRRAVAEAEEVRRRIGEDRIFRLSGNPIDPYYGLIKTLWIKNNLPDVYRKAAKILSLKDFLVARLTGTLVTDVSHAGLSGIAYDIRRNCWNRDVLEEVQLDPNKLPEPLPSDDIAGTLTTEAASELGLTPGTPVAGGMIDSAAGYLACGCIKSGQSAMTLGTSSCWGIYSEDALWPTGMNITKAPWNPKGYLINASLAAGGAVLTWLRELFFSSREITQWNELEEQAARVPIGCGGLLTLPHFLGERAPLWDPYARGVLFGLHTGHSRADLYRSAIEGIALSFYRNKLLLQETGVAIDQRIVVTGGSGRSPLFRRILADVLDSTVDYVGDEVGSDYGAAWLAGKATGVFPSFRALCDRSRIAETIEPDPSAHRRYVHLYDQIYRDLYPGIKEMYPKLANLPKPVGEPSSKLPGISKQR